MANNDVLGLIYAGEQNTQLRELVSVRAIGALPIAGRYRAIDFQLSNMVNSGIKHIGLITQKNYLSLIDHLGSGKDWGLNRKNDGLFIFPPYGASYNLGEYAGLISAVKNVAPYIEKANQNYCILTGSFTVYNALYDDMISFHMENNADITIMYNKTKKMSAEEAFKDVRLSINNASRVVDIEMDSAANYSELTGMDIYFMRKNLLLDLVEDAYARGKQNFLKEVLIPNLNDLNVYAYEHKGYVGRLTSAKKYYDINMDFLKPDIQKEVFLSGNPVYTKIKDEIPVQYGKHANIKNSLIANGCIIKGTVENSIIFRGVNIGEGAVVKNSILMQESHVYDKSYLDSVILDKRVCITGGKQLISSPEYPVIIRKGAIL